MRGDEEHEGEFPTLGNQYGDALRFFAAGPGHARQAVHEQSFQHHQTEHRAEHRERMRHE